MAVPDLKPLTLAELRTLNRQATQDLENASELHRAVVAEIASREASAKAQARLDTLSRQEKEVLFALLRQELNA